MDAASSFESAINRLGQLSPSLGKIGESLCTVTLTRPLDLSDVAAKISFWDCLKLMKELRICSNPITAFFTLFFRIRDRTNVFCAFISRNLESPAGHHFFVRDNILEAKPSVAARFISTLPDGKLDIVKHWYEEFLKKNKLPHRDNPQRDMAMAQAVYTYKVCRGDMEKMFREFFKHTNITDEEINEYTTWLNGVIKDNTKCKICHAFSLLVFEGAKECLNYDRYVKLINAAVKCATKEELLVIFADIFRNSDDMVVVENFVNEYWKKVISPASPSFGAFYYLANEFRAGVILASTGEELKKYLRDIMLNVKP